MTCETTPAGELLDNLPPGADEAIAIAKIVEFAKSPEYSHFTRIIIDTAPTGHTLRLLTLPDFFNSSIGAAFIPQDNILSFTRALQVFFDSGHDFTILCHLFVLPASTESQGLDVVRQSCTYQLKGCKRDQNPL